MDCGVSGSPNMSIITSKVSRDFSKSPESYRTNMWIPLTSLFDVIYIYFYGPLHTSDGKKNYTLFTVENLIGWPIYSETQVVTYMTMVDFMKEEDLLYFCLLSVHISDNSSFFTKMKLTRFMGLNKTSWEKVLEYAQMRNGSAERMVGSLKAKITSFVVSSGNLWDTSLLKSVYGSRCRKMGKLFYHSNWCTVYLWEQQWG